MATFTEILNKMQLQEEKESVIQNSINKLNKKFEKYWTPIFEDKEINPIIENAMNTNTKNHDFFSVKGDGYVVSMNVESIEDEDFIFE